MNPNNNQPSPVNQQQCELQPQLRAVPMTVFPTSDSLTEVVSLGNSRLPITNSNDLFSLLAQYHNTLLKQVSKP